MSDALAHYRQMKDLLDPQQIRENQERMRNLLDPPLMRQIRENQERMRNLLDPPLMRQMREQQARIARILNAPLVEQFRVTRVDLDDVFADDVGAAISGYQVALVESLLEAERGDSASWFGAESWKALLGEIEGLLKSLEFLTTIMAASAATLSVPVPAALIAVILMLIVAGELALWVVRRSLDD